MIGGGGGTDHAFFRTFWDAFLALIISAMPGALDVATSRRQIGLTEIRNHGLSVGALRR